MTTVTELPIAADHPAFVGHFPNMPIVPAVVLLDETLHAIARMTGVHLDQCTLHSAKFMGIVRPGQPLTLRFERTQVNAIRFEIHALGQTVASGMLMLTPPTESFGDG
jgi:3-hydroxyacyl-[acyl-carrier-protein] dehydratase